MKEAGYCAEFYDRKHKYGGAGNQETEAATQELLPSPNSQNQGLLPGE
jgi:hypothetical protein